MSGLVFFSLKKKKKKEINLLSIFSRTYGGFSNDNMKREELLKLMESLKRDGVQYIEKPYYVAGYDSPFKLTNRRNEVWILKNEEEQ